MAEPGGGPECRPEAGCHPPGARAQQTATQAGNGQPHAPTVEIACASEAISATSPSATLHAQDNEDRINKEALALIGSESFDLAIPDLNLGGILTYPVADVLREKSIPFIFAAGYGSDGLKEAYSDLPTLQKPFNQEALGQAIMATLSPKY
ncbi:hypothetical protein [Microvirga sesbaniae]|uniref:hypothetical protein n=1 Tax=Microvirga sesbaniae TaxID=681392 RepID=UPI0021CA66A4|nr:hypothetical protein [Microvirga sp. HBU67692]